MNITALRLHILCFSVQCLTLSACGDTSKSTSSVACFEHWQDSYGQRFIAGETYYLPVVDAATHCRGLAWSMVTGPEAEENTLIQGDAFARFTPTAVGEFRFELKRGSDVVAEAELTVIDPLARPFHNYNYFPTPNAAAVVDDVLWVPGVYTPQLAAFNLKTQQVGVPILVGQWPTAVTKVVDEGLLLVTNKASDTLGFVSLEARRQVDALWVGDEPSNVVYSPRYGRAYVALSGARAVAVVDVRKRQLITTIDAVFDPLAMALSPDESTLAVASHRSGQTNMYPYGVRDVTEEKDIALIDLETNEVRGHILEVATTIQAMHFDSEGQLWVSATSNQVGGNLNDPASLSFQHELFTLQPEAGLANRGVSADLTRQASSGGPTATLQGFSQCGDSIWIVAEGANQLIELDSMLRERRRLSVTGRPRIVACSPMDTPLVISSNRMTVTLLNDDRMTTHSLGLTDRRNQQLIHGLERFAGQGDDSGSNRSCNSCHVDGLSDRVIWNAGPVVSRMLTRPFRWLEGTSMIGWDGYVGRVKISGYVGGSTINHRGNTEEAIALGRYIGSIMPAPAANQFTHRDGALSTMAQAGKRLFEGEAGCTGCHSGLLTTNRQVLPEGITPGQTDVPSLVDVARIGSWYKTGEMTTLRATVVDTAEKFGRALNSDEVHQTVRYLQELTGRDFFVLDANFGPDITRFPIDGVMELTFSYPALADESNLSEINLSDSDGENILLGRSLDGRHLTLRPTLPLAASSTYVLTVPSGFQSDDARQTEAEKTFQITTAAPSTLTLDGVYSLTVAVPMLDFVEGVFDWENLVHQTSSFTATATKQGANVQIDYGGDMVYDDVFVLHDNTLITAHIPIAVGPAFLNGSPIEIEGQDVDGDGVMDLAEGRMKLTGPGVDLPDIAVKIEKTTGAATCVPGSEGGTAPMVMQEGETVTIDWGTEGALVLFVASPEATLPLGPGMVDGGETYWGLSATNFPTTFNGPVTYGVTPDAATDISEDNGGTMGGLPLESGRCYRFSVVVNFAYSHTTIIWP